VCVCGGGVAGGGGEGGGLRKGHQGVIGPNDWGPFPSPLNQTIWAAPGGGGYCDDWV